jgi:hypothetical protein
LKRKYERLFKYDCLDVGFYNNKHSTMTDERTYIMVKPDGLQRGLVGEIISRFEKRGYLLRAIKEVLPS